METAFNKYVIAATAPFKRFYCAHFPKRLLIEMTSFFIEP